VEATHAVLAGHDAVGDGERAAVRQGQVDGKAAAVAHLERVQRDVLARQVVEVNAVAGHVLEHEALDEQGAAALQHAQTRAVRVEHLDTTQVEARVAARRRRLVHQRHAGKERFRHHHVPEARVVRLEDQTVLGTVHQAVSEQRRPLQLWGRAK